MLPFSKQQEAQNYSAKFAAPFLHLCRDPTVFRAAFMQQSCLPHQLFVSIYSCACKNVWLSSNVLKHLVEPTFYHFLVVLLHKSRSTEFYTKNLMKIGTAFVFPSACPLPILDIPLMDAIDCYSHIEQNCSKAQEC